MLKSRIMKNIIKVSLLVLVTMTTGSAAVAQNETATIVPSARTITETPVAPPVNKPAIIMLRNAAEKSVAIFAGPKEEIKEPKIIVVGGLSKNTLYLKENDAVCLMTVDKRPVACTIIKPGVTTVEVNVSANAISSK